MSFISITGPRLAAGVVCAVLAGTLGTPIAGAQDPTRRLDADDGISFALAVSQEAFATAGEQGASAFAAVIARDDLFADSLAAGALLGAGPLLYVPGGPDGQLPGEVAAELQRVLPPGAPVYLAGGEQAVGAAVAADVADLGFLVTRLAGAERTETAVAVAEEAQVLLGQAERVVLATAGGWPDAVAAGAAAASESFPILLTDATTLSVATDTYLDAHPELEVIVVGGPGVVSEQVATEAEAVERLAGSTRASTATAIEALFGDDVTGTSLTQGFVDDGWVFGNAGASLLQPLFLTGPGADTLGGDPAAALPGRAGPLFVLGAADRISDAVVTEAEETR